jgi:hypothetical protein
MDRADGSWKLRIVELPAPPRQVRLARHGDEFAFGEHGWGAR